MISQAEDAGAGPCTGDLKLMLLRSDELLLLLLFICCCSEMKLVQLLLLPESCVVSPQGGALILAAEMPSSTLRCSLPLSDAGADSGRSSPRLNLLVVISPRLGLVTLCWMDAARDPWRGQVWLGFQVTDGWRERWCAVTSGWVFSSELIFGEDSTILFLFRETAESVSVCHDNCTYPSMHLVMSSEHRMASNYSTPGWKL
ncbi:hypothetical protein DNTS_000579 [Danionella cerebrum]|uniref:Uncharacterized protein n=1 Tax=Danionella cerebrum TaxID=2873325 RepID=A0A553Q042_9TELE|nr:hypothetical protein DNTS_000579 [Danionella translucida]